MNDIYYDNDGDLTYHPLESLNLITKASEKQIRYNPPSVYDNLFNTKRTKPNINNTTNTNVNPFKLMRGALTGLKQAFTHSEPLYVDNIPKELTDKANMIEHPDIFLEENPEWKFIQEADELGMRSYINEVSKKIEVNFHGYDGRTGEWNDMVFKQIPNPFKDAGKAFSKTKQYLNSKKEIEALLEEFPEYELSFNGHSWGAYQARYFASEYDSVSNLFNAHIMPWNKFKSGGEHFFHTTITDPTDFKHIFPMKNIGESHFYYPSNPTVKNIMNELVDGHYISNFSSPEVASNWSKFSKVASKTGILKTLGIALTAKDAADAVSKDFKNDHPLAQKLSDSTIDVANKTQEFVVGNAVFDGIFAGTVALAPETGGVSILAGAAAVGGVVAYTAVSEALVPAVKKGVVKGANFVSKKANKFAKSIKHLFHW